VCLNACSSGNGVTPETAAVSPATGDTFTSGTIQFSSNVSKNAAKITWAVNGTEGGDATNGTITSSGLYTAPAAQPTGTVTVTATNSGDAKLTASAAVNVVASGTVSATANSQVALYTIAPPVAAGVTVQFGTDTTYGLMTSQTNSAGSGMPLGTLVAGMKASTVYHMRASLLMPDGTTLTDADHTFTTGTLPKAQLPIVSVETPNGLTPQPGVQLMDIIGGKQPPAISLDLEGNLLWYYIPPDGSASDIIQPIKQLPNGDFILNWSPTSTYALTGTTLPTGTVNLLREIDFTGKEIRSIDIPTLNTRLASAGFTYTALTFHHDICILPNGHLIVLINSTRDFTNLPSSPGKTVTVLGDALVELDNNLNPVWLWDMFNYLDINREPYMFPDWTHANAVLYSPSDGDLVVSIRHQNWLIKIDYQNGKGTNNILWHLGYQGDFTLEGGTAPQDWFFAEHGPSFNSTTTAGQYGMTLFDNGDDRDIVQSCADYGQTPCPYSSAKVWQLDETAMTATLAQNQLTGGYSNYGGNAETLANGNIEADTCYIAVPAGTMTTEKTPDNPPQLVWQLTLSVGNAYRSFRMPSLYPGVQW
jgi:arylsulfate sulfotransferase